MTFMSIPYAPMKNKICMTIIIKSWPMKFVMHNIENNLCWLELGYIVDFLCTKKIPKAKHKQKSMGTSHQTIMNYL
jgi:hypothetical protein